jgi:hypothetical protein
LNEGGDDVVLALVLLAQILHLRAEMRGENEPAAPPSDSVEQRRYLRAWRVFAWTLAGDWAETPPQSSREIAPLVTAITALVNEGVFEDSNADTAAQGELSLLRLALAKLAKISDEVESAEVAGELRGVLALVPRSRNAA